jgi:hypothetical protein
MIEERAAKQAADADAKSNAQLTAVANGPIPAPGTAAPAAPQKSAFDPSVIALISLALGSLAAAFAGILGFLKGFENWQVPLVIAGIMLVISAPSMAIAWLKLRKRNLGPILDANGWAVNAKARMNVPFGGALTSVAALPAGATFGAADKFAEKPSVWPKVLAVAFAAWFIWAFLNDSQGRLWRWTENSESLAPIHKVATVPAAVQKARDEADTKTKLTAPDAAAGTAPTAPSVPAAPAAPVAPTPPAK